MMKLLLAVMALIAATLVGGAYFNFNPTLAIFIILGLGVYGVGRIGGPRLPGHVSFGETYGVYLEGKDFAARDTASHSGPDFRDGVDPNARRDNDKGKGLEAWR
jgi:hypothetical protein